MSAAGGTAAPLCDYEQEARYAVVLYGGVSLAIYINGIVQELLHLVQATAPAEPSSKMNPDTTRALVTEPTGTEVVYRRLGQMLCLHGIDSHPRVDGPIRTRFVVDILSGSSAGGINAIVLAKALANDTEVLQEIRNLWITEADIAELINDEGSRIGRLKQRLPPRSLLNSERMYYQLLGALDGMDTAMGPAPKDRDSRLVDELDCWITTTDLEGLVVSLRVADEVVQERRYKNVFRLVYRSQHTSSTGSAESDFKRSDNPFLAFAARCTSSFPFAFEPMELTDIDRMIRLPEFVSAYGERTSTSANWKPFFPDYALQEPRFSQRAFADGGILDNKPFTWATDTLALRRADFPVVRRLVYVEPAPDPVGTPELGRPNAVQTVAATYRLPRVQSIREDIDQLRQRNADLQRIWDALKVTDHILVSSPHRGLAMPERDAWVRIPLEALIRKRGLQWAAYHRLHVEKVLDELAKLLTTHVGFDQTSDGAAAVRLLMQVWFENTYESEFETSDRRTQASFLSDFSLGYRLRRLHFLDKRMEEFLSCPDDGKLATRLASYPELPPQSGWQADFRKTLWKCKARVNDVIMQLRRARRQLRSDRELKEWIATIGFHTSTELANDVLRGTRTPEEALSQAHRFAQKRNLLPRIEDVTWQIASSLRVAFDDAFAVTDKALATEQGDSPGRVFALATMRYYFNRYENFDAVFLPLSYGAVGDAGFVEVMRISPASAKRLINEERSRRRKLAGVQFGHFGGFLSEAWRRNDMMWGRLDAAECLIEDLVPAHVKDREGFVNDLVRRAHMAILEEERKDVFPNCHRTTEQLYEFLGHQYSVDLHLDRGRLMKTVQRALGTAHRLFEGIGDKRRGSQMAHAATWLASALTRFLLWSVCRSTYLVGAVALVIALGLLVGGIQAGSTWLKWVASVVLVLIAALTGILVWTRGKIGKALTPRTNQKPARALLRSRR